MYIRVSRRFSEDGCISQYTVVQSTLSLEQDSMNKWKKLEYSAALLNYYKCKSTFSGICTCYTA
jgi:hypothetical protein